MRASVARLVMVLIIGLAACEGVRAQERSENSQEVHFPQYNDGHLLYAPVKIADHSLNFMVDTGFSTCAISKSYHELLGPVDESIEGKNAAGHEVRFQLHKDNWIEVPNVKRLDCLAIELDTRPFESLIGIPMNGVLGSNFLGEIGFGYAPSRNTLYFGLSPERQFDTRLAMDYSPLQIPRVKGVHIDGLRYQPSICLDTGSLYELAVPFYLFDALVRKGKIHSTYVIESYVVGGTIERKVGRLNEANIWGTNFTDIPVSSGTHYVIGLPLLRRFDFYFDFASKQLCIQSNSDSNLPFPFDNWGLYSQYENGRDIVMKVAAESPAEEAGVRVGDALLAIDGKEVQPPSMDDISEQRYGVMKVTLMRDGKTFDRTIELRDFRNTTAR